MDESYRKYIEYRAALTNACESANVGFVGGAVISEIEFGSAMARLPHEKRAIWQERFQYGYEQAAFEQKKEIVAALAGSNRIEKQAA